MMRKTVLLIIVILSTIVCSYSQIITGKLISLPSGKPTIATIYLNGNYDEVSSDKISKGEEFVLHNVDSLNSIEIKSIEYGTIVLTDFKNTPIKRYELGNIYMISDPNNKLYHIAYKSKIGILFKKLTERKRTKKFLNNDIKKNEMLLRDNYDKDGKPYSFLDYYNGQKQILSLKSLKLKNT